MQPSHFRTLQNAVNDAHIFAMRSKEREENAQMAFTIWQASGNLLMMADAAKDCDAAESAHSRDLTYLVAMQRQLAAFERNSNGYGYEA